METQKRYIIKREDMSFPYLKDKDSTVNWTGSLEVAARFDEYQMLKIIKSEVGNTYTVIQETCIYDEVDVKVEIKPKPRIRGKEEFRVC